MDPDPIPWTEVLSSIASAVTAAGVIAAGVWAYFRFVRDAPHWTRADARIRASVLTDGTNDVVRADIEVRAIGHARITFKHDEGSPVVTVYTFSTAMLEGGEPDEWIDVLAAQRVLTDQRLVEAGETVSESHLLPLGRRLRETLAYRLGSCSRPTTRCWAVTSRGRRSTMCQWGWLTEMEDQTDQHPRQA